MWYGTHTIPYQIGKSSLSEIRSWRWFQLVVSDPAIWNAYSEYLKISEPIHQMDHDDDSMVVSIWCFIQSNVWICNKLKSWKCVIQYLQNPDLYIYSNHTPTSFVYITPVQSFPLILTKKKLTVYTYTRQSEITGNFVFWLTQFFSFKFLYLD